VEAEALEAAVNWKRLTLYGVGSGSKKYSTASTSLVVNHLIQRRSNATSVGIEPRSRDHDHTVTVKKAFNTLGHAADSFRLSFFEKVFGGTEL